MARPLLPAVSLIVGGAAPQTVTVGTPSATAVAGWTAHPGWFVWSLVAGPGAVYAQVGPCNLGFGGPVYRITGAAAVPGVEPVALWTALRQCALGRVRTFDRMGNQFMQHKFDPPDFALKLAHKDVTLATELAREIGVPMKIASITHAEMTEALNRGWGHLDSRAFLMLQKEL